MSAGPKHPRAQALDVARELTRELRGLCAPGRFIFAGSLRRLKPEVGDVEVVYIPRIEPRPDPADLLGNRVPTNLVDARLDELLAAGWLTKRQGITGGTVWGQSNKLAVHVASGIGIDLFAADKRNFWTLLVCRTGSADHNTRICNAAIKRGLKWNPYRGFEDRLSGDLLYVPDSEEGLFRYLNLPYLEPKERV